MTTDEVRDAVVEVVDALPDEVVAVLGHVEEIILERPRQLGRSDVPDDARAFYEGTQIAGTDDAEEMTEPPRGVVYLFAANLTTPEEVKDVVLHEIGHALGLDEDEVEDLGL